MQAMLDTEYGTAARKAFQEHFGSDEPKAKKVIRTECVGVMCFRIGKYAPRCHQCGLSCRSPTPSSLDIITKPVKARCAESDRNTVYMYTVPRKLGAFVRYTSCILRCKIHVVYLTVSR